MRGCSKAAEEVEEAEGCCAGPGCGKMGFKSCVDWRFSEQQGRWQQQWQRQRQMT
jgi:hypothetical protein